MAIKKYQMIFRQLFYFKHVERVLCRIWIANSNAKRFSPNAAEQYRSAFALRQRMMNAIQNFEYYMMIEVIEPNWHMFSENLNTVKTLDEVIAYHQDFQDQCLKNCMLMDVDLLKTIIHLCNVCIRFSEFIEVCKELVES
jgi:gamma-tubulin complex component 2